MQKKKHFYNKYAARNKIRTNTIKERRLILFVATPDTKLFGISNKKTRGMILQVSFKKNNFTR